MRFIVLWVFWVNVAGFVVYMLALTLLDYPMTRHTHRWQDALKAALSVVIAGCAAWALWK